VLDASEGREPLTYLHGVGNIVAGLEKAMTGKKAGDKFQVDVSPEEGYGVHNPGLVQVVPRDAFRGVDKLEAGMQFRADSERGPMTVVITSIERDKVTVDGNHPLAGATLHFAVEITEVREASVEEVLHGHVHGAGGHHH
jgi:FKBP-type peptidyl-prolyl cis-trans isomerase SlyD